MWGGYVWQGGVIFGRMVVVCVSEEGCVCVGRGGMCEGEDCAREEGVVQGSGMVCWREGGVRVCGCVGGREEVSVWEEWRLCVGAGLLCFGGRGAN